MTCVVKAAIAFIGFVVIAAIPAFMYGLITGRGELPDWWTNMMVLVLALYALGCVIYLSVDLALRQNRKR